MCLSRKAGRRQRPEKREDDEKTRSEERSGVFVQRENSSCSRDKSHFSSSSSDEAFFSLSSQPQPGKKIVSRVHNDNNKSGRSENVKNGSWKDFPLHQQTENPKTSERGAKTFPHRCEE
jgi:hypothetical protein